MNQRQPRPANDLCFLHIFSKHFRSCAECGDDKKMTKLSLCSPEVNCLVKEAILWMIKTQPGKCLPEA